MRRYTKMIRPMNDEQLKQRLRDAPVPAAPSLDTVLVFRRKRERLRAVPVAATVLALVTLVALPLIPTPRTDQPASYTIALPTYTGALAGVRTDRLGQPRFTATLAGTSSGPRVPWTSNLKPPANIGETHGRI